MPALSGDYPALIPEWAHVPNLPDIPGAVRLAENLDIDPPGNLHVVAVQRIFQTKRRMAESSKKRRGTDLGYEIQFANKQWGLNLECIAIDETEMLNFRHQHK